MVLIKCFFWGVWVSITPQLTGPWVCNTTCFLVCTTSNSFWGCNLMFLGLGFCMQLLECCLFCSFCLSQARFFFSIRSSLPNNTFEKGLQQPFAKGMLGTPVPQGLHQPLEQGEEWWPGKTLSTNSPSWMWKKIDNTLQKVKGETRLAKKKERAPLPT